MKKNKWYYILGAIVLILLLTAIFKGKGSDDVTAVTVEQVSVRTIVETVSANGKIQPEVEVIITSDVPGEIVEMNVEEGDTVTEGELLVKINPDIYISGRDRAQATLNSSKANLANSKARLAQSKAQLINATAEYKRSDKLYKDGAISGAEFDQVTASFEVAKAEVEAAEQSVEASKFNVENSLASLKEAEENLRRTNIFAPVSGTIYNLQKEKGERVTGASQFSEGTEIFRIANLNNMEVSVEVNENDIVRVNFNDTAEIEVDAYLNRTFYGIVTEIANSANSNGLDVEQVTTFDVKVRILPSSYQDLVNPDKPHLSPFRPGMSATVEIRTAKAIDVLAVPIQSVTTREDTTSTGENKVLAKYRKTNTKNEEADNIYECVFLFVDGGAHIAVVETGIQDSKYIEIKTGVEKDAEVISGPYTVISKKLEDKDKVEKVEKSEVYQSFKE